MTTINCINNNLNNSIFYKELNLTSADFMGMFASPIEFLPAAGANNFYNIFEFGVEMFYNSVAYTGGGSVSLRAPDTTIISPVITASNFTGTASISVVNSSSFVTANLLMSSQVNQAVYISNATGAFATGNSTFRAYAWYSIENILNPEPVTMNALNNRNGNQYIKTVTIIPSSDVLNLGTTPYTVIPAPGSNKVTGVQAIDVINLYNSSAYNAVALALNYAGDTTNNLTTWGTGLMTATASTRAVKSPQSPNSALSVSSMENKAITLRTTSGVTSGNSPLKVISYYSIFDI